ncbi:MAG TPA: hypothetical protein VH134_18750, partial [Candidatus Dormibacteraeota bacterium]|nr:hypothetical protein [Candidatus Dormibacteraeota bacterium]
MSPGDDGTSSAVPADLRAYSQAALQIDEQIHELALRLGRTLDAYRATRPEFGAEIPRIEDDLARYAQRCREIDARVGQIADAFEHAGAAHPAGIAPIAPGQPVVVAEAVLAQAVQAATAPPPPKPKEHHDRGGGGLLGGLFHAVEHPMDTLGSAASAVEHVASDALGTAEHAGSNLVDAGAALVHGLEHPSEALAEAATGLENAAGGVKDFVGYVADEAKNAEMRQLHVVGDVVSAAEHPVETVQALESGTRHLEAKALQGLEALGGRMLHDIEHPMDALKDAETGTTEFMAGFASGVKDMAGAALLLARVIPGTPMWAASMAVDPVGTMKLQEQFARGLVHMASNPGEALGNMIDIKDLEAGNFARWEGHIAPDVIVTLLTMGGGGVAAATSEGVAKTAAEATAEDVSTTVAEESATVASRAVAHAAGESASDL